MMPFRSILRESDAAAVRQLVTSTGFFSDEEVGVAVELVEETLVRGSASGYRFLFADGEKMPHLAGYACYGPIPATASSFDLYWIAVAPAEQRSGLGGRLLRAAEADSVEAGAERMYVDTAGRQQYASTRAFYAKHGYRKVAELEDFYAPSDAKIIFMRRLSNDAQMI